MHKLLVIDDEIHTCTLLQKIFTKAGFEADTTMQGGTALKMAKEKQYEVIFCDYRLKDKGKDGLSLYHELQEISPTTPLIIMTGYPDVRLAIHFIKEGAYDYIAKPLDVDQLILLANKAVLSRLQRPTPAITTVSYKSGKYVYGESNNARILYREIALVAPTEYSVLITGETGTGKESVARQVHIQSRRSNNTFIAIDCGSLSKELALSELMGHEKGAFTGAIAAKAGAFREAQHGTLFLDEIANLSYDVQTALLRVLQERKVRPVGSVTEIPVDIRIITATNENLRQAVLQGRFREDLFFRLNEFSLNVPPLRERQSDLHLLAESFKAETEKELGRACGPISDGLWDALRRYKWPGNIRELKNTIRRMCLLTPEKQMIMPAVLSPEMKTINVVKPATIIYNADTLKTISRQAEQEQIVKVLRQVNYNKAKAARLMNIDRKTLYNKINTLQIEL